MRHVFVVVALLLAVVRKRENRQRDGENKVENEYDSAEGGAVERVAEVHLKCEFSQKDQS